MEGRCEICECLRSVLHGVASSAGTMRVCAGCESAVPRVAALQQREESLVRALTQLGQDRPELYSEVDRVINAPTTEVANHTSRLVEALRAVLRATHVSQGGYSGHTLEEIKKPGRETQWACIMPGCAVCAARALAEAALKDSSS